MKIFKNKSIWTAAFYFWLIGIYILTSMTFSEGIQKETDNGFRTDYLEHFLLFVILPVLYFFAEGAGLKKLFNDNYYILLIGLLFAVLTEIQQYYIPGRSFNPIDLILNITGFISGIYIGKYAYKRIVNHKET